MNLWIAVFSAFTGYFLGAISFTRIIGKIVAPDEDLTKTKLSIRGYKKKLVSRAVSATSLRVRKGPKVGILTSILDMLKAALPVLAFRIAFPEYNYFLITAAAGVAGHNYPVYHQFKGGRGMSPLFGGLFVIDWLAIPVTTTASLLLGLAILRDKFFAVMGCTVLLIPWIWFRFSDWFYLVYALAINILFWTAIRPELKEYLRLKRSAD